MKIRTLYLDLALQPGDLPNLRGAVVERIGRDLQLFHNHSVDPNAASPLDWGYPLIQYGLDRGRATITGIAKGADALADALVPHLLSPWTIKGKYYEEINFKTETVDWDWSLEMEPQTCKLSGWLALNKANYRRWKHMDGIEDEEMILLSQCLTGQLRSLGESLGMPWYKNIHAEVVSILRKNKIRWHHTNLLKFDVLIETNLKLPKGIHVGRAAAFGFGKVMSNINKPVFS